LPKLLLSLEVKVNNQLVSVSELARILGVHPNTIRNLADRGAIPSVRTAGNQRRFDPVAVKQIIDSKKTGVAKPGGVWRLSLEGLQEDLVWRTIRSDLQLDLSLAANDIAPYVFLEMLNNAIDHSRGTEVEIVATVTDETWAFSIHDNGIGVFKNIRDHFLLNTDIESIAELSKGKQTTDPSRHTGEGIFFSSKLADNFTLASNGLLWQVNSVVDDQAIGMSDVVTGTQVSFSVATNTEKRAELVFKQFTRDGRFAVTNPRIHLFEIATEFLSRSEAKRLMTGLERFDAVELDFKGVEKVGQAFVDEVFRVWQFDHQNVQISWHNANPAVRFMIERGLPAQ